MPSNRRPLPQSVLAAVLLVLAPTSPALAVDGVIELNQASALAGNPAIGDTTPGYPIRIAKSGSYRLTSNLNFTGSATEMIDVDADDVTIDLNGFTVGTCIDAVSLCIPLGADNGIDGFGDANLTVRNGTVKGLPGLGIRTGVRGRVENVVVRNVQSSGILVAGEGVVRGSSVLESGTSGITAGISAGERSLVAGNVVSGNGYRGISADTGTIVEGNTIVGNGNVGIQAFDGVLVRGNLVRGNVGVGLDCGGASTSGVGYLENVFQENDGNAEPQVLGCSNLGNNLCRSSENATCP